MKFNFLSKIQYTTIDDIYQTAKYGINLRNWKIQHLVYQNACKQTIEFPKISTNTNSHFRS